MTTNELSKKLQDLTSQKEKSKSEMKDFQNKLKILKEENDDFRNKNNQLHETLKMKINDLKEAEECVQYLKEKSKQVFQNEHHNDHTYTSYSQRPDKQLDKDNFKTNFTSPTNQISLDNHSCHKHVNHLIPELSSTNNSRTKPAQAETLTIVILKTAVGRIIGRKGNKINKIQLHNNVEITTSLAVGDYQDVKITGNTNSNINNALKETGEIVLCKNFSSNCCTYGPNFKFQHRNNIEIKNNRQPNGNIHFNITHRTSNTEIQNSKNFHTNQTIRQQRHAAKAIEDQIIQALNQKALTEIIQVPIKEYLDHSLVAVKQEEEAKKMKQKSYPKIN